MVALLVFITATFATFCPKINCWTQKGPFGDNVVKNPARYRNFHKKVIFQSVTQADQEKQIRALPTGVKPMTPWSPVQIWSCINQAQNSLSHLYLKLLSNIPNRRQCFIPRSNTKKIAENKTPSRVLLTKFEVFDIVSLKIRC